MQPFFYFNQIESSPTFFYFGNKGQGSNDFLRPYSIQYIDSITIGVWDVMSSVFYEFGIPKENETLKIDKKIKMQTRISRIIKTAFNQYIGLSLDEGMFLLSDSTGIPVNTFFEYPYQNNEERQFKNRSFAYQGTLSTNPSNSKFVYAPFRGEIIHFYEIENNNIKSIVKIEKEHPLYKKVDDEYQGVLTEAKGKTGYIATYATEKFVYAIYSGKIIREQGVTVNFEGQILRIFDWNGVFVKEYALDVPCSYLCVSDDDRKIWAIASNPDISLVFFDMENAIERNQIEETQRKEDFIDNQINFNREDNRRKEEEFINSLPEYVNAESIDGTMYYSVTDSSKFFIRIDTVGDTIINGIKYPIYQMRYGEN